MLVRPAPFSDPAYETADGRLIDMADFLINGTSSNDTTINLEKRQTLRTVLQYISIFWIIFYAYVVFVIARHLKITLNNPFYAYVISLAVSDFLILIYVAARLPEREIFKKAPWFWMVPFWVQFCWYANLFNVLGLTCTRFVAVVLHRNAKNLLQWRNVIISIIIVWFSSFVWAVPILFPTQREWAVDRKGNIVFWELAQIYRWTEIVFSVVVMLICFILYIIMFEFVRRARRNLEKHKSRASSMNSSSCMEREPIIGSDQFRDRTPSVPPNGNSSPSVLSLRQEFPILIQSFLITASLSLVLFSSYAYIVIGSNFFSFAFNQCAGLLNSALNPILYVLFSTAVRDLVFSHARDKFIRRLKIFMVRAGISFGKENEKFSHDFRISRKKISQSCPALNVASVYTSLMVVKETGSIDVKI